MKKLILLVLSLLFILSFFTACFPPREGHRRHHRGDSVNRYDKDHSHHHDRDRDRDHKRRHRD